MISYTTSLLAYAILGSMLLRWVIRQWTARAAAKWKQRMEQFVVDYDGKEYQAANSTTTKSKLLLIVVPSSGAGRAMDLYPDCIRVLRQRNFNTIQVYVTKSSEDVQTLLERRKDLVLSFEGIILLGGDSSVTEIIQQPLTNNVNKVPLWPYPPILHLPGGSTNVLSKELHKGASHERILREFSLDNVVRGSVIKITAKGHDPLFATHVCFHGFPRHLLTAMEEQRHTNYAAYGPLALIPTLFKALLFPKNRNESPHFALVIANTATFAGAVDSGFGMELKDDKLLNVNVREYKGFFRYVKSAHVDVMNGNLAKQFRENSLPEEIEVKIGKEFTIENYPLHFVVDGTTTLCLKANQVTVTSVPNAIPYLVL